ncbi:MAG TPA: large conductance mechanosensitive channel protein MscL [Candidatus Limnocylindrales bacterium]|nr:large conductance mechanosensitive channel protein MscL [Candidatus Limnocylindrales bacterium]
MFKGFREFVLRGNVVDLAVGVVIGAAFGTVVTAFVKDLLTPVIAAIAKKPDFSGFFFEVNGAKFLYGDFVNAIIAFLLIALAVYYFVVLPVNALMKRFEKQACPIRKNALNAKAIYPSPLAAARSVARRLLSSRSSGIAQRPMDCGAAGRPLSCH